MKRVSVILLIVLCIFSIVACTSENDDLTADFEGFRAVFLNTGKADCIIIQTDDFVLMCDTAESGHYSMIAAKLNAMGINSIDYMILTHYDKDHIGSAGAVIKNFDVKNVYAPDASENSDEYRLLMSALEKKNMLITYVTEDLDIKGEDCSVHIYAPLMSSYDDDNSYSLITSVEYKEAKMLLTGDATKQRLSEFIGKAEPENYEVIKLPHHGEYTKPLSVLLGRSQCTYGIVTCDSQKSTVEKKLITTADKENIELLYTYEGEILFTYAQGGFELHR